MRSRKGFTFIELLITLVVLSIALLPLMQMFSTALEQMQYTGELTTARYLAMEGMEKMKNLNFTAKQLIAVGDVWDPPLEQDPLKIDQDHWRTLRKVVSKQSPVEVHMQVFKAAMIVRGKPIDKPMVELVTLVEDFQW